MNREETYNIIATLLEEGGVYDPMVADRVMEALETMGEDILDHLDPPPGLRTWLESHGLSLVVTSEVTPPQIWSAIQGEDGEEIEEADVLEEEAPQLGLGDYVDFQTATSGPRGQSRIGAGWVVAIVGDTIEVEFSPGGARIILFPGVDHIRQASPPLPRH